MDLISRQAAIDAVISLCDDCNTCYCGSCRINDPVDKDAKKVLEELPSAHPEIEERKEESAQNVPKEDLISRKAAIDALMDFDKKLRKINWYQYPHTEYECRGVDEAIVKIENVPSAQPDGWLEQNKDKILQAGMEGREIDFRIGGRLFAIREKAQ